jgi:alpha 1,2-mannosyltransferase
MVMLARNSDMDNAVRSVRRVQDRFNAKFGYPWVFLNEEPFTDEFKQCGFSLEVSPVLTDRNFRRISNVVDGKVEFGLIPHDDWFPPDWIDEDKAAAGRKKLENVIYGSECPLTTTGAVLNRPQQASLTATCVDTIHELSTSMN